MPEFFKNYLETLTENEKIEIQNWLAETSNTIIVLSLFQAIDSMLVLKSIESIYND